MLPKAKGLSGEIESEASSNDEQEQTVKPPLAALCSVISLLGSFLPRLAEHAYVGALVTG